jgi:hypothetical protein
VPFIVGSHRSWVNCNRGHRDPHTKEIKQSQQQAEDSWSSRHPGPAHWAKNWREECRANSAIKASLKVGATVISQSPLHFRDGGSSTVFRVAIRKGSRIVFAREDGIYVRLSRDAMQGLRVA